MWFVLGETTLEWGLGAHLLSLNFQQWPITGPDIYINGFTFSLGYVRKASVKLWQRAPCL